MQTKLRLFLPRLPWGRQGEKGNFPPPQLISLLQALMYREPKRMKTLHFFLLIVFFLFALAQYNDPDPWGWMVLYGGVAFLAASAWWRGRTWRGVALLGLGISVVGLLWLLPAFWQWLTHGTPSIVAEMKATAPHIELVREFLGLVLCAAAYGFYWRGAAGGAK